MGWVICRKRGRGWKCPGLRRAEWVLFLARLQQGLSCCWWLIPVGSTPRGAVVPTTPATWTNHNLSMPKALRTLHVVPSLAGYGNADQKAVPGHMQSAN